jgi:hypothetical protein
MVIGEGFVWAHLPKTGGDATLKMFELFPQLVKFADPNDGNEKHTRFSERPDEIRGKVLSMNFRRLPSWVLSRAQHVSKWGIYPDYKPLRMGKPDELARSSFPDTRIQLYTSHNRYWPDHWLRMESLADDFTNFISRFHDVTDAEREQVQALRGVNEGVYDHDIAFWFEPDHIERMYLNNPLWATLEQELYGDLYELKPPGGAKRS